MGRARVQPVYHVASGGLGPLVCSYGQGGRAASLACDDRPHCEQKITIQAGSFNLNKDKVSGVIRSTVLHFI